MPQLSRNSLNDLDPTEFERLVVDLLVAEGSIPESGTAWAHCQLQGDAPIVVSREGRRTLIEAKKSGASPLSGVSLPGVAGRARTLGVSGVEIYVTAALSAERLSRYQLVIRTLENAAGVQMRISEADEIVERLNAFPDLVCRWFPTEAEALQEAHARNYPRPVSYLLTKAPLQTATAEVKPRQELGRLGWTAAIIAILVWLPVSVSSTEAWHIGAIGLAAIAGCVVLARRLNPQYTAPSSGSVMSRVVPVKFAQSLRREIFNEPDWKIPAADYVKQLPGVLLTAITRTALLLFLISCTLVYLLTWGLASGTCTRSTCAGGAFTMIGSHPHVGVFVDLAVQAAFFNLPSDISPNTSYSRGLIDAEFVLSAVLLGSYAAFYGFRSLGSSVAD